MSLAKGDLLTRYQGSPYETHQLFLKSFEKIPFDPISLNNDKNHRVKYTINGSTTVADLGKNDMNYTESIEAENAVNQYNDRYSLLNSYMTGSTRRISLGKDSGTHLTRTYTAPGEGQSAYFRHNIKLEPSAIYTIVDRVTGTGERALLSDCSDFVLSDYVELTYVKIVDGNGSAYAFNDHFYVNSSARLKVVELISNVGYYREKIQADLVGEGGEVRIYSGFSTGLSDRIDHTVMVKNDARRTTGHAFQRAIVNGSSKALLKGLMKITERAINSDSFLDQHSLLLARNSFSLAIPGLEIDNNELKAKHSASVSQIDQDQLFYLMTRGLNRAQAVDLVAQGFLTPVAKEMPVELMDEMIKEGKVYGITAQG